MNTEDFGQASEVTVQSEVATRSESECVPAKQPRIASADISQSRVDDGGENDDASEAKMKDAEPSDADDVDPEEKRKAAIKARLAKMGAISMMPGTKPLIPAAKQPLQPSDTNQQEGRDEGHGKPSPERLQKMGAFGMSCMDELQRKLSVKRDKKPGPPVAAKRKSVGPESQSTNDTTVEPGDQGQADVELQNGEQASIDSFWATKTNAEEPQVLAVSSSSFESVQREGEMLNVQLARERRGLAAQRKAKPTSKARRESVDGSIIGIDKNEGSQIAAPENVGHATDSALDGKTSVPDARGSTVADAELALTVADAQEEPLLLDLKKDDLLINFSASSDASADSFDGITVSKLPAVEMPQFDIPDADAAPVVPDVEIPVPVAGVPDVPRPDVPQTEIPTTPFFTVEEPHADPPAVQDPTPVSFPIGVLPNVTVPDVVYPSSVTWEAKSDAIIPDAAVKADVVDESSTVNRDTVEYSFSSVFESRAESVPVSNSKDLRIGDVITEYEIIEKEDVSWPGGEGETSSLLIDLTDVKSDLTEPQVTGICKSFELDLSTKDTVHESISLSETELDKNELQFEVMKCPPVGNDSEPTEKQLVGDSGLEETFEILSSEMAEPQHEAVVTSLVDHGVELPEIEEQTSGVELVNTGKPWNDSKLESKGAKEFKSDETKKDCAGVNASIDSFSLEVDTPTGADVKEPSANVTVKFESHTVNDAGRELSPGKQSSEAGLSTDVRCNAEAGSTSRQETVVVTSSNAAPSEVSVSSRPAPNSDDKHKAGGRDRFKLLNDQPGEIEIQVDLKVKSEALPVKVSENAVSRADSPPPPPLPTSEIPEDSVPTGLPTGLTTTNTEANIVVVTKTRETVSPKREQAKETSSKVGAGVAYETSSQTISPTRKQLAGVSCKVSKDEEKVEAVLPNSSKPSVVQPLKAQQTSRSGIVELRRQSEAPTASREPAKPAVSQLASNESWLKRQSSPEKGKGENGVSDNITPTTNRNSNYVRQPVFLTGGSARWVPPKTPPPTRLNDTSLFTASPDSWRSRLKRRESKPEDFKPTGVDSVDSVAREFQAPVGDSNSTVDETKSTTRLTTPLRVFIQPHHRPPQSPSSDDLKSPSFMQEWERIRTQRQLKSPSTKASSVSPKSNDGQVPEFMRLAAKFRAKHGALADAEAR